MSYCWRTYFATTKLRFLQRRLQSVGAFKQATGEATFQRIRVRNSIRTFVLATIWREGLPLSVD
jgi:hypothetical protein